jgi:alpha-galactosidase
MIEEFLGEKATKKDVKVNPVSVNHFTWLTSASYHGIDLFPYYEKYCEKYVDGLPMTDNNWMNNHFASQHKVKFDLFRRFGYIAAAGDRHLAEFCPGKWYLENPDRVHEMKFGLTPVSWRKGDLKNRLERSKRLLSGEEEVKINNTGEEGVDQMRALLGLCDLVTNVNVPNVGQIPNLPLGAVVETNAAFRSDSVLPVMAGPIPNAIYPLVSKICTEQEALSDAIANRDLDAIFEVFASDPLVTCSLADARKLFDEMVDNTKKYLTDYNL